jgi:hypothetical protein
MYEARRLLTGAFLSDREGSVVKSKRGGGGQGGGAAQGGCAVRGGAHDGGILLEDCVRGMLGQMREGPRIEEEEYEGRRSVKTRLRMPGRSRVIEKHRVSCEQSGGGR